MPLPPVLYEDGTILALDKPGGLFVAHDCRDKSQENLMALVHARFGRHVASVHRLDADISGVLLCAKTKPALDFLSGQFQAKSVEIIYHALVAGRPALDEFTVELALAEDEGRPGCMRVAKKGGKSSVTSFRVLARFRGCAWLECRPLTGRTHQLRVHLAAGGTPVLCDSFYGDAVPLLLSSFKRGYKGRENEKPLLARVALHASELAFAHPATRERTVVRAPLPHELEVALKYLKRFAGMPGRA